MFRFGWTVGPTKKLQHAFVKDKPYQKEKLYTAW